MTFRGRGPVTTDNIIVQGDGTIAVPFSTNSHTGDEYFLIDADKLMLVIGRCFYAHNDDAYKKVPSKHYSIRSDSYRSEYGTPLVARVLHMENILPDDLTVDHCFHWTDCRRVSLDFVPAPENSRRGAAVYHRGRRKRTGVNNVI